MTIALSPALLARIDKAAMAEFETRESFIPMVLANVLPDRAPRTLLRDGGKAPAPKLLRPVKALRKRGRVLAWFLRSPVATVRGAMTEFGMTRQAVFSTWTTLHREHGIGYAFDSSSDGLTVRLPCDESKVFVSIGGNEAV